MNIVFVTTQSPIQSTLIGRVLPLAQEFQKMGHKVMVLVHREQTPVSSTLGVNGKTPSVFPTGITIKAIGSNPFKRTQKGKKRHSGLSLIWTMKINALRAAWLLIKIKPDVIIIAKPLPENTFAVYLAKHFLKKTKIILDVDDFELEANQLTSLLQRAAIHWSERVAVHMASHCIVATPFLEDHMRILAGKKKPVTLVPTGLPISSTLGVSTLTPSVFPIGAKKKHVLLFVGSISVSSGHRVDLLPEILYEVRKSIPDVSLIIAGSGDDEHILRQSFEEKGLQNAVTWRGRFSMETIESLIRESTILLDPVDASIANRAKSSFRVALALAYGLPIVTSSIGIRTTMVPATLHTKFFAKPGDVTSYANTIVGILQKPITDSDIMLLQDAATQYTYSNLAQMYYNCIV